MRAAIKQCCAACVPQGSFIIAIIIAIHGSYACACICTDTHTRPGLFSPHPPSSARQLEMRNTCTRDLFFAITLVAQIPNSRERNSFLFRWSQAASASYSPLRLRFIAAEHMRQANARTLKFAYTGACWKKLSNIFIVKEFLS